MYAGALALLSGGEEESSYGHTGSSYGESSPSSGYGGHGRAGHFRRKPGKKRYQKRYYRSVRNEDSNIEDYIGKKVLFYKMAAFGSKNDHIDEKISLLFSPYS